MVYYPLQLLQLAGIREVLIVTGKQHAGDFIDLLGDGRVDHRDGERTAVRARSDLQGADTRPAASPRSSVWPRASPPATGSSSASETTSSSTRKPGPFASSRTANEGARIFVKEVSDPERFGVVAYGEDGRIVDVVEKAGVVDRRYDEPPSNDAVVGLYCFGPDVFEVIRGARAVRARRARDHRREPCLRGARRPRVHARSGLVARRRARTSRSARIGTLIEETGVNKVR